MTEQPVTLATIIYLLSWEDWGALIWFLACWSGYAYYFKRMVTTQQRRNLLSVTNHYRLLWMRQACVRIQRPLDGILVQNISSAPSFFASTSIIVIGGVLAMLSSNYEFANLFAELPFAEATSLQIFHMKVVLLLLIFVFAFFRFSWSIRQYTYAALVIGAIPDHNGPHCGELEIRHYAQKAGRLLGMAAEAFNAGIRAYYFSFAVISWFFTPVAFALVSTLIVIILYHREFHSKVLQVMKTR